MRIIWGFLFLLTTVLSDNKDSLGANNKNKLWFYYKPIIDIFYEHFVLIMSIIGCILSVILITCTVYKCQRDRNQSGYTQQQQQQQYNEGIDDYGTESESDIEVEKVLL